MPIMVAVLRVVIVMTRGIRAILIILQERAICITLQELVNV